VTLPRRAEAFYSNLGNRRLNQPHNGYHTNAKIERKQPPKNQNQLKAVRARVFAVAVKVRVTWVVAPTFRMVFCLFQVKVSKELAMLGVKLLVVIVRFFCCACCRFFIALVHLCH
jgi:hypothetical protein